MSRRNGVIRIRTVAVLLGAGLLAASSLGVTTAGAQAEALCPATEGLGNNEDFQHEASALRSHLGCQVSEDPGPADPGQ